jgi:glutamate dehydrogenase
VVAIADGFGAAYDPHGLDWKELLRLVHESKSIAAFNPDLITTKEGFVIVADTKEKMRTRDQLYAKAEAELFIPAGGRPYTVNDQNWSLFLKEDGTPSANAIVEGANIFFTKTAREKLIEKGVVVIKDSSANKGGVCASSYEIIACLILKPEEFYEIKNTYVAQVLDIIKKNADLEAKMLFREWNTKKSETNLVKLSYDISFAINRGKDIIMDFFNQMPADVLSSEKFSYVLLKHCPAILVEKYQDRILKQLPKAHKIAILSAAMASHLIYREGLEWAATMNPRLLFETASSYIYAEKTIQSIIESISKTSIQFKDEVSAILKISGPRYLALQTHQERTL